MQDHCLVRSSMRHAPASCRLQRLARTNDIAQEGSMTMHVLDRPGIARRVSKTFAPIAAVAAALAGMTAFALPAGAATVLPAATTALPSTTYSVSTVLSGKKLHHSYTKVGSSAEFSEPLTKPDDITRVGSDLFTAFQ